MPLTLRTVLTQADRRAFVDLPFRLYRDDPHWVPPLKREALGLITPEKNGWYSHAKAQLFLAEEDGRVVGRISAHIDLLALTQSPEQGFGPGTGQWGLMEAEREDVFQALLARAEDWLRDEGMTRALGPISQSIWEEPGLLIQGYDHAPTVMMGRTVTPGDFMSISRNEIPSWGFESASVRTRKKPQSACWASVVQVFCPFTT